MPSTFDGVRHANFHHRSSILRLRLWGAVSAVVGLAFENMHDATRRIIWRRRFLAPLFFQGGAAGDYRHRMPILALRLGGVVGANNRTLENCKIDRAQSFWRRQF